MCCQAPVRTAGHTSCVSPSPTPAPIPFPQLQPARQFHLCEPARPESRSRAKPSVRPFADACIRRAGECVRRILLVAERRHAVLFHRTRILAVVGYPRDRPPWSRSWLPISRLKQLGLELVQGKGRKEDVAPRRKRELNFENQGTLRNDRERCLATDRSSKSVTGPVCVHCFVFG